jgi:hypothetical protein
MIELVSGAISMGLGGYLAAKSEAEHYETEREREGKQNIYIYIYRVGRVCEKKKKIVMILI